MKKKSRSDKMENLLKKNIDKIPSGYENLSEEEIEKVCNEAIASLYKNKQEDCEIAFGVKKKC